MATITGTDASDFLVGTDDGDLINGGLGNDTIRGLGGNDTLNGAEGDDSIDGGDGNDYLIGGAGNDTLEGGKGADTLEGGAGNDVLRGGKGHDSIVGGDGNDTIYSGYGQDTLTGGAGSDVFVLKGKQDAANPSAIVAPTITDFVAGTDSIVVEGVTTAEITTALAGQTTVEGGVSFKIGDGTIVVKGTGLIALTAANVTNVIPAAPLPSQTFVLTTGVDNFTGGTGDDVFNAYINTTTATTGQTTFSGADVLNGAEGTDRLNLTVEGANAAGSIPAATISNIEHFYIRDINTSGASTYDFGTVTGETQVWNDRSTQAVTFSNLAAGTTLGIKGDNSMTHGGTTFTMAAATNAVSIAIDGGTKGGNITRNATGEAAVTITSTGLANTVGTIDLDTAAAIKSVTIDATTNLTASLAAADYAASSTLTLKGAGVINLSGAALSANITTVNAADSTGGVSVIMGANTATFTGGAGNDTVSAGALVFNTTGTLNGGAGTNTLVLQDAAQLTATTATKMTNFQVLRLNDDDDGALDTFNASLLTGLTGLVIGAQSAADGVSVTNMSATLAGNVTIAGNQVVGPTFGVTGASTVGQLDTLTIKIDDGATAVNTLTVADITAAGVETVNLQTVDALTLSAATGLTALTNLNVTGSGNVSITTGALALNVNTVIDATALTGTFTFNGIAGTTNGLAIKGSTTKANTITGTNQADSITAGSANDTITGGNGIDSIDISQGGDDVIVMEGIVAAANRNTITGFTAGTYTAGSGVDRLEMNDAQATTAFAAAAANLQEITTAPTGAVTFNTAANNVLEFAFDLTGNGTANDLDSHTDGTGLLASLGQTISVSANGNTGYIVAYQDGKAYLYHANAGADSAVAAGEIALVAVFNGITAGAFTASNFIDAV